MKFQIGDILAHRAGTSKFRYKVKRIFKHKAFNEERYEIECITKGDFYKNTYNGGMRVWEQEFKVVTPTKRTHLLTKIFQ